MICLYLHVYSERSQATLIITETEFTLVEQTSLDLQSLGFPTVIQNPVSSLMYIFYPTEGTHLTTDVINCHMNKDGCFFYTLQVHMPVT